MISKKHTLDRSVVNNYATSFCIWLVCGVVYLSRSLHRADDPHLLQNLRRYCTITSAPLRTMHYGIVGLPWSILLWNFRFPIISPSYLLSRLNQILSGESSHTDEMILAAKNRSNQSMFLADHIVSTTSPVNLLVNFLGCTRQIGQTNVIRNQYTLDRDPCIYFAQRLTKRAHSSRSGNSFIFYNNNSMPIKKINHLKPGIFSQ